MRPAGHQYDCQLIYLNDVKRWRDNFRYRFSLPGAVIQEFVNAHIEMLAAYYEVGVVVAQRKTCCDWRTAPICGAHSSSSRQYSSWVGQKPMPADGLLIICAAH